MKQKATLHLATFELVRGTMLYTSNMTRLVWVLPLEDVEEKIIRCLQPQYNETIRLENLKFSEALGEPEE